MTALENLKYNVTSRQEEQAARKDISDAKKWKLEWREDWESATRSICEQLQQRRDAKERQRRTQEKQEQEKRQRELDKEQRKVDRQAEV